MHLEKNEPSREGPPTPWPCPIRGRLWGWLAFVSLLSLTIAGWREFWFLTDDAHITFRYISNHLRGYGYTWNPPPFRRVEGYSNFLWMVLLEAVWRVTGVTPPASANWISLLFGCGTLWLGALVGWRLELPRELSRFRFPLAVWVVIGTISNRTFLTWLSSGLETALFGFLVTLWVFSLLELERTRSSRNLWIASVAAALSALTRPDGLLFSCATAVVGVGAVLSWSPPRRWLSALTPLLIVPTHVAWRLWYYGEWLPNTYYAKTTGWWPESGLRYLASFILEYGYWTWLCVALAAGLVLVRDRGPRGIGELLLQRVISICIVLTVGAQAAYYTFITGGDHFEYRVYAHLVLLLQVALIAMVANLGLRALPASCLLVACLLASLPIQWTHYALTRDVSDRDRGFQLYQPVADSFPAPFRFYAAWFDAQQSWLIRHFVGLRHEDHETAFTFLASLLPSRASGEKMAFDGRAVMSMDSVGVAAWVLPEVAILDEFGLNDWVIARTPVDRSRSGERFIAHERRAPPGYIECFEPNVQFTQHGLQIFRRARPLSDDQIRDCETRFAQAIQIGSPGSTASGNPPR